MANDINNIFSNRAAIDSSRSSATSSTPSNSASIAENTGRTTDSDRVTLTSTANKMKNIEQQFSSSAPVDQQRIQSIQSAIARGEYNVNPEKIADRMLSMESMM